MNVIETKIPGVLILEPRVFKDARGYFFESYSQREFDEMICAVLGHPIHFVQDNESMSSYGVMRGLHYQRMPYTQTFGQHVAVELNEDNHLQFFVPRGFAHGFSVLSETAVFQYKCDAFYHPASDAGINIKDESFGIDWRIPAEKAILSEKDLRHANLLDGPLDFDFNDNLYPEFSK